MARVLSAAMIKRNKAPPSDKPCEGSRMRELFDIFQEFKGRPITLKSTHKQDATYMRLLQDMWGLDIRQVRKGGCQRVKGGGYMVRKSQYMLVGEWFGRVYIDYTVPENGFYNVQKRD